MAETKSERIVREAFKDYRKGNFRDFLHQLIDFADKGIRNMTTEEAFKTALDAELAEFDPHVSRPDEDAPQCCHCGSTSTWWRSDGDVACNNCPGIMPYPPETPDNLSTFEG